MGNKVPLYKVKCKRCKKEFEEISTVKERNAIKCECGGRTKIMICPTAFHIFEPFDHPNLGPKPVRIKSRKHLQQEANRRNMRAEY